MRLVALLREPVSRALSSINMVIQRGDFAELHGLTRGTPEYAAAWRNVVTRELNEEMSRELACLASAPAAPQVERVAAVDACMLKGASKLSERVLDVHLGMYALHLSRWLAHFPPNQLLLWSTKAFKEMPWHHMAQLVRWLGLDPSAMRPEGDLLKLHKRSYPEGSLPRGFLSTLADFYAPHNAELFALLRQHGYSVLATQLEAAWPVELAETIARLEEH